MNFKAFWIGFFVVAFLSVVATSAEARSRVSNKGYSSSKSYSAGRGFGSSTSRYTGRPGPSVNRRPVAPQRSYTRPQQNQRPIVQKNYYNNGNMGGGGYRGGMGGYQGPGIGTSILGGAAGAVGGMMLYDALKGSGSNKEAAQLQREQALVQDAKEQQARDDKMEQMDKKQDQILQNQQQQLLPPQEPFYQLGGQHQ